MVGQVHVSYLVRAARAYDIASVQPTDERGAPLEPLNLRQMSDLELGRWLTEINLAAMKARPIALERGELFAPAKFVYVTPKTPLTPEQVLKAVDCFEYQAQASGAWRASAARELMDRLRRHAAVSLPGYAAAAWVVTE